MMGGTIWAESGPGKGSTFHVTIVAQAAPAVLESYEERGQPELAGKRLLVVDDNATNREIIVRYAESWGMLARASASPREALEWIRSDEPFDLALLDMQMPEMDGVALAREIRRSRGAGSLPLVLLTSLGRRKEDLEAGVEFAAYLAKPIKASQLYDALMAVAGEDTKEPRAFRPEGAAATRGEERPPLRILVAEDNEVNQKLALLLLEKMGYAADVAANGLEALEALRRRRYDVILMDVEMPAMDGLEASRRIHSEWSGGERPRIVAMTANAIQGDRETCLAAGMDDYVSKPIRPDKLAAALARCTPLAAPAAQQGNVLDHSALDQLEAATGDPSLVAELIDIFLRDAPALLTTLKNADAAGQAEELRRAAHTLKSNARTFGAGLFAELCQELETRAKTGTLDGTNDLVARIEAEYASAVKALDVRRTEVEIG